MLKKKIQRYLDRLLDILFGLALLVMGWIFCQVFLFTSFKIPTDSMEPTLIPGDEVLVFKPLTGARLFNLTKALNLEQTYIYRIPGLRKIRHNDVLVFNFPHPNNWGMIEMHILKYYIKRCVALPGDTLSIRNGYFHVSGYTGNLGNTDAQRRISLSKSADFPKEVYNGFPYDSLLNWNIRNFGPLFIPRSGSSVAMDRNGVVLYRKPIEWEQGKKLVYKDSSVLLGDSVIQSYTFTKNYYFMAGDHGENSQDSRYWGLLPEEYIVGKAVRIWKSVDKYTDEIRWKRIWKKIR